MDYIVLFTHQKTKKAKTWQDGTLSMAGNKAILYDDKKTKLDSMYIKPEMIVKGEQIESDRYFILIEDVHVQSPAIQTTREPVQPVTCPVRVPVRTGLKRKRTGFVPPRVIRPPDNQVDKPSPLDTDDKQNSYLDILKGNKQDNSNVDNGYNPIIRNNRNVLQLYSTTGDQHQAKMSLPSSYGGMDARNSSEGICLSPNVTQNNAGPQVVKSPSISLQSQTPSGLSSPWSSYGTKMKQLSHLSPKTSLSPLIHNSTVKHSNGSESQDSQLDNSESEQCLISANNFQNSKISKQSLNEEYRQKEDTDIVKPCDIATSDDSGSKRSMSQIMALLGKQKNASSKNDQTENRHSFYQANSLENKYHDNMRKDVPVNIVDNNYACSQTKNTENKYHENLEKDLPENFVDNRYACSDALNAENNGQRREIYKKVMNEDISECYQGSSMDRENLKLDKQREMETENFNTMNTDAKCRMAIDEKENIELSPSEKENIELSPMEGEELKENVELINVGNSIIEKQSNSIGELNSQEESSKISQKLSLTNNFNVPINNENEMQKLTESVLDKNTLDSEDMSHYDTEDDLTVSFNINFSPLSHVSDSDSIILSGSNDQSEGVKDDVDDIGQSSKINDSIDMCEKFKDNENERFDEIMDNLDGTDLLNEIKDNLDGTEGFNLIKDNMDVNERCDEIKDNLDGNEQCDEIKDKLDGTERCDEIKDNLDGTERCDENKDNLKRIEPNEEITDNQYGSDPWDEIKDNMEKTDWCNKVKDNLDGTDLCEEKKDSLDGVERNEEIKDNLGWIEQSEEMTDNSNVIESDQSNGIKDNFNKMNQYEEIEKGSIISDKQYSSKDSECKHSNEEVKYADSFDEFMDLFDSSEMHNVNKSPHVLTTEPVDKENHLNFGNVNARISKIPCVDFSIKNVRKTNNFGICLNDLKFSPESFDMSQESHSQNIQLSEEKQLNELQHVQYHKEGFCSNTNESENFSENSISNPTTFLLKNKNNSDFDTLFSENSKNSTSLQTKEQSYYDPKESFTFNANQTDSFHGLYKTDRENIVKHLQTLKKTNFPTENKSSDHLNNDEINIKINKMNDTFESGTSDQFLDTTKDTDKEYYITDNISQNSYKADNLIDCKGGNACTNMGGNSDKGKNSAIYKESIAQQTFEMDDTNASCVNSREMLSFRQEIPIPENKTVPRYHEYGSQSCFTTEHRQHMNKPRSLMASQNVLELQHPQDVFGKKRKMSMIQDQSSNTKQQPEFNDRGEKSKDLRCTASEKLENYMMKGSIVSGAARRQEIPIQEYDMEESFYIDCSTEKPSIQSRNVPSILSKFYSSPAQFVPNTPDFLKSMKTQLPSQSSGDQSSPNVKMGLSSSEENFEFEDKQNFLHSSEYLNTSKLPDISSTATHKKLKTPLISSPYEDKILELEDRNFMDNKDMSHSVTENQEPALTNESDNPKMMAVGSSCESVTKLTYWEEKLLQRQKSGNIFIKNDLECEDSFDDGICRNKNYIQSAERTVPNIDQCSSFNSREPVSMSSNCVNRGLVSITSNCIGREPGAYVGSGESSMLVGYNATNDNEVNQMHTNINLFEKERNIGIQNNSKSLFQSNINEGSGSKWGKYESEDEDDFLAFDASFSLPSVSNRMKNYNEQKFTLRPPTSHIHNDTIDNVDSYTEDLECFNETFEDGKCTSNLPKEPAFEDETDTLEETDTLFSKKFQSLSERRSLSNINHSKQNIGIPSEYIKNKISSDNREEVNFGLKPHFDEKNYSSNTFSENAPSVSDLSPDFNNRDNLHCKQSGPNNIGLNKRFKCLTGSRDDRTLDGGVGSKSAGSDVAVPSKRFKCPVPQLLSCILKGTKRNLGSDLQFPSLQEVTENTQPTRDIEIPSLFQSLSLYKQIFTAALKEHLNIILFDLGVKYHHALAKIDTSSYFPSEAGKENKGPVNRNPVCKCGAPSKMIQVKKSGPNQNRFFYACNAARNNQCKFFQWADDMRGSSNKNGNDKLTMSDPSSITTFIRSHHVHFYCDCSFVKKSTESIMNHFKRNVPNWVKQKMGMDTTVKKRMYIQLSRKENSSIYSKDDLWIISKQLDFKPSSTILCRSTYYGPTSGNEIEIEPIGSFSPSNWPNEEKCHAILAGNVTGELSYLTNLEENVTLTNVPVLQTLLSSDTDKGSSGFNAPARLQGNTNIYIPESYVDNQVEEMINQYKLNDDQSTALLRIARMFTHSNQNNAVLIHGVFGAGKSFLLSVVVLFLVWLFEKNDTYTPGVPFPWKLVIASTTNVAVDRILNGLLALGFEDFVRVGSVKKISKPVLPYSVHGTGSDSQELKDLQMMLRSGELTAAEKQNVRQSIERHKLGENRKRLGKVRVVGVTCASCSSQNLKDMQFPIVLLDECSQMTEPASMLPVAKFQCQKLVLVGDPKQLDPTIQGSESTTDQGLEQTLFDRLILMGHSPVMLHMQYRCHPHISGVSNSLFYSNTLQDGVFQTDRQPVMEDLPALCFYDVPDGIEQSDSDGSFYNEKEAEFIVFLIEVLIGRDVEADRIGVISLYKSQMYKIMASLGTNKNCKELKAVMVSTVDAFQGGERDVIILSCVRTRNVGFIDNEKRTNVALTRARHHLLIVGNGNNLKKNKLWGQIIQHCKDSTPDGVQRADSVREKFKIQEQDDESSRSKSKKRNQTQISDNTCSSSPPMSLSGSSKSSLREITDKTVPMTNVIADSSDSHEFNMASGKRRRKRRRIDASLLDCDNLYNSSDDEDLPVIFDTS